MRDREDLLNALFDIRLRLRQIQVAVSLDRMTPQQAGSKLRSLSIELGTAACMPFREQECFEAQTCPCSACEG